MSKKEVSIDLTDPDGRTTTAVGVFDEVDWEVMNDFLEYSDLLFKIHLFRKGGPAELRVKHDKESGLSFETRLPPDDQLSALLHRIRPFVLTSEKTNVNRVCNIIGKSFDDNAQLRNILKLARSLFSGERILNAFKIESNDVIVNSEKTLHDWLNAFEYHKDKLKQEGLNSLYKSLPEGASKAVFVMMLNDKAESVRLLTGFLNLITGKAGRFSIK